MIPLKVDFRDIDPSPAVQSAVEEKVAKLEKYFDRITSCHVIISHPHKHHNKGHSYHVTITLAVPGKDLVANRENEKNHAHEDVYVALRDAFQSTQRQLQDYIATIRGETKTH